jgi:L-lactate dehydrogenase complex protein LldG
MMSSLMTASTSSKNKILDRLRSRPIDSLTLPTVDVSKLTRFDDPVAKFVEMLAMVGGEAHFIERPEEAKQILDAIDVFADAKQIASLVPEAVTGNIDVSTIDDPHELESLDWVIVPGDFIVAENGAIWVDGAILPHRVMLFIPQYLAIFVSRSQVVHHMHQAYAKIGHPTPGFGVFISGPSKTADIEQSLVLGAHGCRKMQVFLTP